jgi:hypothetical protein
MTRVIVFRGGMSRKSMLRLYGEVVVGGIVGYEVSGSGVEERIILSGEEGRGKRDRSSSESRAGC